MFTNRSSKVSQFLIIILALQLITPTYLNAYTPTPNIIKKKTYQNLHKSIKKPLAARYLKPLQQSSSIQLFGPNQDANPVVNENNQIQLTATDSSGNALTDVTFESGSPDVASIDSQGMVSGKVQGYATVTARSGNESISIFVTVAKVDSTKGKQASGDTKVDSSGAVYISDPTNHIIFKRESAEADAANFAGKMGSRGKTDGDALESLFAGPTAVAVDNRSQGGIYIADTLNHSVRRVDFNNKVTTILGTGAPGINTADVTPFSQAAFSSPQGIAVNSAGNLFVADTNNHAIYMIDFAKQEVRLLAGEPGVSGKVNDTGRAARFSSPTALSIQSSSTSFFGSSTSEVLFVSDTGNNRIRSVAMDGTVTTVGKISSSSAANPTDFLANSISPLAESDEFVFNTPRSVSVDELGNIYVVDSSGAKVITQTAQQTNVMTSLGQPNVSFSQAMSVVVRGTQAFVLDNKASETEALKVVTIGEPQIDGLSQDMDIIDGGAEITIRGKNFGPETIVVVGDSLVRNAIVDNATTIRLIVPPQNAPGKRTISVQTRGGVTQQEFTILAPPFRLLNDGEITTVSGGIPFLGDGGKAIQANLKFPRSIATDGQGNTFIVDAAHNRVRKIDRTGKITSVAGTGASGSGPDGGPAIATALDLFPFSGVTVDSSGSLLVTEAANGKVRRVDGQTGIISTIAGTGQPGFSGDGGLATSANLTAPSNTAVDSLGNIFISDTRNNRIRRVDGQSRIITTFAGNGQANFGGDGGPATSASLNNPDKIAFDLNGNLLIADTNNHRIRMVDARTGIIRTIAGNGRADFSGDGGSPTQASLNSPNSIAVTPNGNILIADTLNRRIRAIDINQGIIVTIAGNGMPDNQGDNGPANRASIGRPEDIALDGAGNLLISDSENGQVRIVNRAGMIKTLAGSGQQNFGGDGRLALLANIDLLVDGGVIIDRLSNIFFIDQSNQRIRRIDARTGMINTVAGNGQRGFSGDGGIATQASLNSPKAIAFDTLGNLLIADTFNNRIRRVEQNGIIRTVAGNGQSGFSGDGAMAINASLDSPTAIAATLDGDILVATANRIRSISRTGIITTMAGNGQRGFSGDGGLAANASFNNISSLATDRIGSLFVADRDNNRIRQVDLRSRMIRTVAGSGQRGFNGDGVALNTALANPTGLTVDVDGNVIFADSFNHRIRRLNVRNNAIKTLAGTKRGFDGDGEPALSARLNKPTGVAVNLEGDLVISDTDNNSIRVVKRFDRVEIAPDFSLDVTPENQTVMGGNSVTFTVSANAINNFNGSISLSTIVFPPTNNITTNFSSTTINANGTATLTITTSPTIQSTNLSIKLVGTAGPFRRSRNLSLSIAQANNMAGNTDFALTVSPNNQTVKAGMSSNFTVALLPNGTLAQPALLSATVDQANSGIQINFSPSSLSSGNATMTVITSSTTPAIDYNIIVSATVNQIVRSQSVKLSVTAEPPPPPPPTLTITNAVFSKPTLTITGTGFTTSGAVINVNQQNVSDKLTGQSDTQITLKGNKKKLNIKKGANQVTVTVNGVVSNTFTFNF